MRCQDSKVYILRLRGGLHSSAGPDSRRPRRGRTALAALQRPHEVQIQSRGLEQIAAPAKPRLLQGQDERRQRAVPDVVLHQYLLAGVTMTIRAGDPVTRELVAWIDHVDSELARVRMIRGDGAIAVDQDAGGPVIHFSGS